MRKYEKISLRHLLSYIEFDYEIIKNDNEDYTPEFERGTALIKLVDLQNTYLGDVSEFRVLANNSSISTIIERLEHYFNDYEVRPLIKDLPLPDIHSWEFVYKIAQNKYKEKTDTYTILKFLLNPHLVYIEELSSEQ